jgi:pimeloyl-ACP methyl ester carboxylesterase
MMSYDRFGVGPPLLLLHGVGHDRSAWWPVYDRLRTHRDVIAVDLPGHGRSPGLPDGTPYTVAAYVAAVEQLIDALALSRPRMAGNSLGGAIALELAATGAAGSAVALAPIGFWDGLEIPYVMTSLRASRAAARLLRPLVPALLATRAGRAVLLAQFYGRPGQVPAAQAGNAVAAFCHAPAMPRTLPHTRGYRFDATVDAAVDVTVAWGTRDRLLIGRQAARARAALPAAQHVLLPHCGHVPMPDDPAAVADLLLAEPHRTDRLAADQRWQ